MLLGMMKKAVSVHGLYALGLNLVLATASTQAADYYVSTFGSDSNPGTSAQPFRTITRAYSYATAGVSSLIPHAPCNPQAIVRFIKTVTPYSRRDF